MTAIIASILTILSKMGFKNMVIIIFAIIIFLGYIFWPSKPICPPCPDPIPFDTSAFIKSMEIKYPDTVYVPIHDTVFKYKTRHDTIEKTIEIPKDIDSLKVATSYFTTWMVKDTILNDSNGFIVITDLVKQNRIQKRLVYPKIIRPHMKIVTETIKIPCEYKNKLKVGFGLSYNPKGDLGLSAKVLYETKRNKTVGLSYDIVNKTYEGSLYITVFGRNKN